MALETYQIKLASIRDTVKKIISEAGENPSILDNFELIADNNLAVFCKPSTVKPKGLTNDLECQPKPVIEYNLKRHQLKYLKPKTQVFS